MRLWYKVRRFLPRAVQGEARTLVQRVSRESWEPLRIQTEDQIRALTERLDRIEADTNTLVSQVLTILEREHGSPPPPPRDLQVRVVGSYAPRFIESGFTICGELDAVLRVVGKEMRDFPRILDFGCGCGRIIRALKAWAPSSELWGADIDPEAIDWLIFNYQQFGNYRQAPHSPPTKFDDAYFDLVFAISVFTHLPEDMQFSWLEELKRITKPGGYLILTTSGPNEYKHQPPEIQQILRTKGFHYVDGKNYGQSVSLPGFYQNAFHAHHYIQNEWSRYFEVIDIRPLGVEKHQDTTLLRRRATPARSSS